MHYGPGGVVLAGAVVRGESVAPLRLCCVFRFSGALPACPKGHPHGLADSTILDGEPADAVALVAVAEQVLGLGDDSALLMCVNVHAHSVNDAVRLVNTASKSGRLAGISSPCRLLSELRHCTEYVPKTVRIGPQSDHATHPEK